MAMLDEDQLFREVYLPAFIAAATEAGVKVGGEPDERMERSLKCVSGDLLNRAARSLPQARRRDRPTGGDLKRTHYRKSPQAHMAQRDAFGVKITDDHGDLGA